MWYNVYTSTTYGGPYTYVVSPAATSFTVTGLTNGVQYYFVVTAVYNDPLISPPSLVESVYSNQATATPQVILLPYTVGSNPMGIAIDASDNVWVANFNNGSSPGTISKITTSGTPNTTTITVDTGPAGIAIDHNGNVWVTNNRNGLNPGTTIDKVTPAGALVMTVTVGNYPRGIAIDGSTPENIWVGNSTNASGDSVSVVTTAGTFVTTVPFTSDYLKGMALSATGAAWVVDTLNSRVYTIDPSTYTIINTSPAGIEPVGIAIDNLNNIWIGDEGSGANQKIVSELKPPYTSALSYAAGPNPLGVAIDANGNIWVVDSYIFTSGTPSVTELNSAGQIITTITVGSAVSVPDGIAIDSQGNVWVVNSNTGIVDELVGVTQGPQFFPCQYSPLNTCPQFQGGGNW